MPLRIGFISTAGICQKNARAVKESKDVVLAAVASRGLEKAQRFVGENEHVDANSVVAYGTYEELLGDTTIEAVYLPLPTALHLEWVGRAVAAGKHILLEKPVALDEGELEKIQGLAKDAGLVLYDGTMWTHNPRSNKITEALAGERVINVMSEFHFQADDDFLNSGSRSNKDLEPLGSLGDVGWYCVRAILHAFNWELPISVQGKGNWARNKAGVLTRSGATLRFSGDRFAEFTCSWLQPLFNYMVVSGATKTVRMDDYVLAELGEGDSPLKTWQAKPSWVGPIITGAPEVATSPSDLPQEALMWDSFAAAVREGSEGALSLQARELTRKTMLVIFACFKSLEGGCASVDL